MSLSIKKNYLTKNDCYKKGKTRTPIGIQIHTIGCAQGTAQAVADYWNQSGIQACVTYICDADESGKVLQLLPEEYYTWADAGYGNRNLITIEIGESDFMKYSGGGASYTVTNEPAFSADILRGYETAVMLCADICKRYKWDPTAKLPSGLYLISSHDEGRIAGLSSAHVDPSHIWPKLGLSMDTFRAAVKKAMKKDVEFVEDTVQYFRIRKEWTDDASQLGAYESKSNAIAACPTGYSVFDYRGKNVYTNKGSSVGTQATEFEGLAESAAAKKILELVHSTDKSGILYSVTAAQMILESGYVTTNLSRISNNCFGMKETLSGNNWGGVWDGTTVRSLTWEVYDGVTTQIYANFRKYPCVEDSIKDHTAYLLGAKKGTCKRYDGLLAAANYRDAITIIKNGGYATDPNYISKICSIIERFGLDKYDSEITGTFKTPTYRVQVGAYKVKKNADKRRDAVKEKSGLTCITITGNDDMYYVICGTFKIKANAEKRIDVLKKAKIEAYIKEI